MTCTTIFNLAIAYHISIFKLYFKFKTFQGWVKSIRKYKDVTFLHLSDGSSPEYLQVLANQDLCSDVTYGSCISVTGNLVLSPAKHSKGQSVELVASKIDIVGKCDPKAYPLHYKENESYDFLRSILHLKPKTKFTSSLLRVRNAATMAIHKYFQENGFCYIHTPILTSNDCEGAGETFLVEPEKKMVLDELSSGDESETMTHFFRHPTYLSVSGQLQLEAVTGGFSRAYNFGPIMRADRSNTRYHLSEFYMIESEMAFVRSLDDIIWVMEDLVKFATKELMDKAEKDVNYFLNVEKSENKKNVPRLILDKQFCRMTYSEAVKCLEKSNEKFQNKVEWGVDFHKEHEMVLVQECGNVPLFVTDFPIKIKPFYSRCNEDGQTVAAVDLLLPDVGELIGGTLREERYDILKDRLDQLKLTEQMKWYLDLREFGSAPHGGFGMGFERYIQSILGIYNIKDTIPFPRWPKHCLL